jgi:hypothetical protein
LVNPKTTLSENSHKRDSITENSRKQKLMAGDRREVGMEWRREGGKEGLRGAQGL